MFEHMQWLINIIKATVSEVPSGTILLWSGAIADIPSGYVICDGDNGTPNLHGKFLLGTTLQAGIGVTGGDYTHDHTVDCGDHFHTLKAGSYVQAGADHDRESDSKAITGDTNVASNLPPFHSLAYIMKT